MWDIPPALAEATPLANGFANAEGRDASVAAAQAFREFYRKRLKHRDRNLETARRHDEWFPGWLWPTGCGFGQGAGREALLLQWYTLLDRIYGDVEEYMEAVHARPRARSLADASASNKAPLGEIARFT